MNPSNSNSPFVPNINSNSLTATPSASNYSGDEDSITFESLRNVFKIKFVEMQSQMRGVFFKGHEMNEGNCSLLTEKQWKVWNKKSESVIFLSLHRMKFAPLFIPIHRRIETACVLTWFFLLPGFLISLNIFCLSFWLIVPSLRYEVGLPLLFLYLTYTFWTVAIDDGPKTGGRRLAFARNLLFWVSNWIVWIWIVIDKLILIYVEILSKLLSDSALSQWKGGYSGWRCSEG